MSSIFNRADGKRPAAGATDVTDVTDVESSQLPTDTRRPIRLGFWVLVVGFGGFLVWAALAPLDEGVSAPATVAIETHRRSIQHLSGGVVKRVLVKEGQSVKQGEVLIELDESVTRANFESVRQNYLAQRAAESRLLAEETERAAIVFHADLMAGAGDPVIAQHMATQTQLFNARRAALARR
ncbi:MAG: biotin/lipoyl-binding protein, partial [Burkholderiales bacterium]|nr:biotin/lipoyl-binding protein [Burkholderiales bacterium]